MVVVFGTELSQPPALGAKADIKVSASYPSLVSHICLKIWIIGGCGKKAMENLYPSGEWQGEKELGNDSRRLESRNKRLGKPP